jgi:undecaprenyl pyrophosphate synthase
LPGKLTRLGHRHGARHLDELLRWCEAAGIGFVSVFPAARPVGVASR